jgi:hypothetical protein
MITYDDFFVKIKNGPKSTFLELAAGRQPCACNINYTSIYIRDRAALRNRWADDRNKDATALGDSVCRRGEVLNEPSIS